MLIDTGGAARLGVINTRLSCGIVARFLGRLQRPAGGQRQSLVAIDI